MNAVEHLKFNLEASIKAKQVLLENFRMLAIFADAVNAVMNKFKDDGRLCIAGNGGSAEDAQYLAAEFVSKLELYRVPLVAEALNTDPSILTAIGNDCGHDLIFSRQLEGKRLRRKFFWKLKPQVTRRIY